MGDQLERTIEVVGELRQVLIEGRQLLKDARQVQRDLERTVAEARTAVVDTADAEVERILNAKVEEGLKELGAALKKALDEGIDHIDHEVEAYVNLARFGNTQGRGVDVMEELARRTHAARTQLLHLPEVR